MSAQASRSLARDRTGAVMVLGVFMAALMIGFIYYVKGIGEAIVFRERMQDAADSAAFAAATVHARGMNLIALINISMAGVLAVVAAAGVVHKYVAPAAAVLAALNAPVQKPGILGVGAAGKNHYEDLKRPLVSILAAGNTAANAVASAVPVAAEARAIGDATGAYRPPVETAFLHPGPRRLPVEDSTLGELAARVGPPSPPLVIASFRPFSVAFGFASSQPAELAARAVIEATALITPPSVPDTTGIGMVPQRLTDSVVLGTERLQLRAVVGGQFAFAVSERGVAVASWGQTEETEENQQGLQALSRISMAQAEYYFDGAADRDQWLWNQRWRARLRRVSPDLVAEPCATHGIFCSALDDLFGRGLEKALVH